MIEGKVRTAPLRDCDGVVHSTYQRNTKPLPQTDCGLVRQRPDAIYLVLGADTTDGVDMPKDAPITCLLCLNAAAVCGKCSGVGEQLHACPYNADVHNDPTPTCHCCEHCAHDCANDV